MSFHLQSVCPPPARNLREQLFREVTSLLITSHFVSRSLLAIRPECVGARELTTVLDRMVRISDAGETLLYQPLIEAGVLQPVTIDATACALITEFFTHLPDAAAPQELNTAIAINLRFLAQHVELKASRAADDAERVREHRLARALAHWSAEWCDCGHRLQSTIGEPRPRNRGRYAILAAQGA